VVAKSLHIGPSNGRMLLHTGRAGLGSSVGHDLTIEVTTWSAEIDEQRASVTASIDLGSLAVREGTGGALPLTDKDRAEIEKNARRTMGVDRDPIATFASHQVVAADDHTTISGTLTLHGVSAPADVHVHEPTPGRYRASLTVTQTEYGIKPYSALLGALKVRDDVDVEVTISLD
jgi:polyisoprenoid-binding protein YceI